MFWWVGEVGVHHHHMCGRHQVFANKYIMGKTFQYLKCLNKSLSFLPRSISQLYRPNRRCPGATPCCESWGALGAFVRGEIQACERSVHLHNLRWETMCKWDGPVTSYISQDMKLSSAPESSFAFIYIIPPLTSCVLSSMTVQSPESAVST